MFSRHQQRHNCALVGSALLDNFTTSQSQSVRLGTCSLLSWHWLWLLP